VTEAERYLRKARESLASASADVRAKRYNSAANRAYYAAFQAAVAALIHWRVRSVDTKWEHRFVSEEFSSKLIRRRKVFGGELADTLNRLFSIRLIGDYRDVDVSRGQGNAAHGKSERFVSAIRARMEASETREPDAAYGRSMKGTKVKTPEECVAEMRDVILRDFPHLELRTEQRNERDFTIEAWGVTEQDSERFSQIYYLVSDMLVDHDVWIVVLPLPPRSEN
jgi:uncharacterized protein (UPF0332 family)